MTKPNPNTPVSGWEDKFDKGKWFYCYENGVMTAITGKRMLELKSFISQLLTQQAEEIIDLIEDCQEIKDIGVERVLNKLKSKYGIK